MGVGTCVRLHGLTDRPELNDARGVITKWVQHAQRWEVSIAPPSGTIFTVGREHVSPADLPHSVTVFDLGSAKGFFSLLLSSLSLQPYGTGKGTGTELRLLSQICPEP